MISFYLKLVMCDDFKIVFFNRKRYSMLVINYSSTKRYIILINHYSSDFRWVDLNVNYDKSFKPSKTHNVAMFLPRISC